MGAASKSIFDVALVALGDGDAVGHDYHSLNLQWDARAEARQTLDGCCRPSEPGR
jgi:hypothetical protein